MNRMQETLDWLWLCAESIQYRNDDKITIRFMYDLLINEEKFHFETIAD